MASVFLSYDRDDMAKARTVAAGLEKAGHSVWWDRQIAGGAEYGSEIEEALKRSDAVVVLWSERAVRSAWVRDEAAAGRDAGKLVPTRLDASDPPMGFRQYQTIDLSQWKGRRGASQFDQLHRAVSGLKSADQSAAAGAAPTELTDRRRNLDRWIAATLVVAALVIGVWLVMRGVDSKQAPVVAVTSADNSASSQQLARDLFVKLGSLQAIDTKPIELVDQGSGRTPDFTFQIAGSVSGPQ